MQAFTNQNFNIDMKALLSFKDVSPKTQLHLRNVYANLMTCTVICAVGMYLNAATIMQGFIFTFCALIGMGFMTYKVSNRQEDENTRIGYLWAIAFCMGFLVGPVMHHLAEVQPMILVQAVSYTSLVFGSFSAVAAFSKRRSYLFLGGIISTIMSCLFWYRMMGWLFGWAGVGGQFGLVYLMTGLFTACLYVIYDT